MDPGLPRSTPCGHAFLYSVEKNRFIDRNRPRGIFSPDTDGNLFLSI